MIARINTVAFQGIDVLPIEGQGALRMLARSVIICLATILMGCTVPEPTMGVEIEDAAFLALSQFAHDATFKPGDKPVCVSYFSRPRSQGSLIEKQFSSRADELAALVGPIASSSACTESPSFAKPLLFCSQEFPLKGDAIWMQCGVIAGHGVGGGFLYEITKPSGTLQIQRIGPWVT